MPIYGYKEQVNDRPATLAVAAITVQEYTEFCETLKGLQPNDENKFVEIYASNFLDAMRDEHYKGYKHPVLCIYHKDDAQRNEFVKLHDIVEIGSMVGRDRQADMMHTEKLRIDEETLTPEQKNMTIEERFNLQHGDPWDRRSEEEKAEDEAMKEKIKEARKKGEMSGDSFGGADQQRASRERFTGNPLSRSDAIKQLDDAYRADPDVEDDDVPDWAQMGNEELSRAFQGACETSLDAELRPVFDDDKMPKEGQGDIHVTKIDRTDHDEKLVNEDGSINVAAIGNIQAIKTGGQVDEELKAAREAAYQAKVDEAKAGKKVFSPDDFAAQLRGDGSADHLAGTMGQTYKGDDRIRRGEGIARPTLSEAAEAAQREYQEQQAEREENARKNAAAQDEIRGKKERDAGIFRGAALDSDGERILYSDLPDTLQDELEKAGLKQDSYPTKNYPYNSELGGRALFPYDLKRTTGGYRVLGGENIEIEGAMQMGDTAVAVISRKDKEQTAVVIYGRPSKTEEGQTEISIVKLR